MSEDSLPGIYRAVVVSNTDTTKQHRLALKIPSIFADEVVHDVLPCLPPIANPLLPKPGTTVWVQFENGNERMPVWTGVLRAL
jgi:hypothetical protein